MGFSTIISNSIGIMQLYLPNLFKYLTEKEFEEFIRKSIQYSNINGGGTYNNNFIVTFSKLVEEHVNNQTRIIRNEFGYFNYLIGEFSKRNINHKEFKRLLLGSLNDFQDNNFINALGEIGACLILSEKVKLDKYEYVLPNKKKVDFKFLNNEGEPLYVDVITIHFDAAKYENQTSFAQFMQHRLKAKFDAKTLDLNHELKSQVYIFPIISGLTNQIIKDNLLFLSRIDTDRNIFQSYQPHVFGNIQGSFFSLFPINESTQF